MVARNENHGRRGRAGPQGDIRNRYRHKLNIEIRNGASAELRRARSIVGSRGTIVDVCGLVSGMRRLHAARHRHGNRQPLGPAHKQSLLLIAVVGTPGPIFFRQTTPI